MEMLRAERIFVAIRVVDADIRKYLSTELSHDRRLCRLDQVTKALIGETIGQKANGV